MEKKAPPTQNKTPKPRTQTRRVPSKTQSTGQKTQTAGQKTQTAGQKTQSAADSKTSLVDLTERFGRWVGASMSHPKVRTVLVGVALILIGALLITHSFWTFPIVIVGVLMVVVAWVGSRLEGSFSVDWGELGAGFEMRAHFKAPARPGDRTGKPHPDDLDEFRALMAAAALPERGNTADEL